MSDRRSFFREVAGNLCDGTRQVMEVKAQVERGLSGMLASVAGVEDELTAFDADFFSSYELSYSMTLAYPREFFEQMADQAMIAHAGVDTLDLVKALHRQGVI
jgi:hypothetical protein